MTTQKKSLTGALKTTKKADAAGPSTSKGISAGAKGASSGGMKRASLGKRVALGRYAGS